MTPTPPKAKRQKKNASSPQSTICSRTPSPIAPGQINNTSERDAAELATAKKKSHKKGMKEEADKAGEEEEVN
jgi:hypothetical protein